MAYPPNCLDQLFLEGVRACMVSCREEACAAFELAPGILAVTDAKNRTTIYFDRLRWRTSETADFFKSGSWSVGSLVLPDGMSLAVWRYWTCHTFSLLLNDVAWHVAPRPINLADLTAAKPERAPDTPNYEGLFWELFRAWFTSLVYNEEFLKRIPLSYLLRQHQYQGRP